MNKQPPPREPLLIFIKPGFVFNFLLCMQGVLYRLTLVWVRESVSELWGGAVGCCQVPPRAVTVAVLPGSIEHSERYWAFKAVKGATEIAQPFFRPGRGWAPGRAVASTAGSLYLLPGTAAAVSGCSARIAAARCCRRWVCWLCARLGFYGICSWRTWGLIKTVVKCNVSSKELPGSGPWECAHWQPA